MRRPRWLYGWGEGKNLFEGSLMIDTPDIKVVEASFNKKIVLFAIGIPEQRETAVSAEGGAGGIGAKYRCDLEWKVFYDPTALPDLIPIDKAKDFMAGAVAVSAGSISVYSTRTVYIAGGSRPSKGNAPVLLDYELAKKIEEARKQKMS